MPTAVREDHARTGGSDGRADVKQLRELKP